MKQRSTTPVSTSFTAKACAVAAAVLMAITVPIYAAQQVRADQFDEQIKAVERQIAQYQAEAGRLSSQAKTLEGQLAKLTREKAIIQGQINISQAKYNQLKQQIVKTKKDIEDNKAALGQTIANLYVDGEISPIEMLASSNNISDYIDEQEYQSSIRDELSRTIKQIETLKKELEKKQKQVGQVLTDQKSQRKALAAKEAEKQQLISETRGQESAFRRLSASGEAKKRQLEEAQQAAIRAALAANGGGGGSAVAGDPSKGGYPSNLANAPQDTLVDPWGMYNRECVSYTAWKVYQKNGHMPYWGGVGNANQWPGNARAAGIPTGSTPRAKSVGVISAGAYGHVVWVESVNGDGTINISQYNEWLPNGGWGQYSERYNVNPSTYDTYIYF